MRHPGLRKRLGYVFAVSALSAGSAACANIADDGSWVIALEVQQPVPPLVEVGDTIALVARALDRDGNPVDVAIEWRTPDPANIFVETATGRIAGVAPGTVGRVQATQGSLVSDLISLNVVARADTVAIVPDTLTVDPLSTTSGPLVSRVSTVVEGGYVALAGRSVIYEIVEPVFGDPAARTVEITGSPTGALVDTVVTGGDGQPTTPVTLSRIPGLTAPDTVEVSVRVLRRSGALVPGSGQRFVVAFQ
ncbi:MAG: hypothetical protein ACM357_09770 [Gemmatimonadota bacterium]